MTPNFREFDETDWNGFAGCESKNPLISDDTDIVIVIDGKQLCVNDIQDGGKSEIPVYQREYDSQELAHTMASALWFLAKQMPASISQILPELMGEMVATV